VTTKGYNQRDRAEDLLKRRLQITASELHPLVEMKNLLSEPPDGSVSTVKKDILRAYVDACMKARDAQFQALKAFALISFDG
jgi:hypothetical protein